MAGPNALGATHGVDATEADRTPLRLTVARGTLGIELYEPVELGPLTVSGLATSLKDLAFPIDLSGGVRVFRHRRGDLAYVGLLSSRTRLSRWLAARWRDVLGGLTRPVGVWSVEGGVGIGVVARQGVVAFDVLWAPTEAEARLVVARPRGAGLGAPAVSVALGLVDSALGKLHRRSGRLVELSNAADALARTVLPALGVRAPRARGLRFSTLSQEDDELSVDLEVGAAPAVLVGPVIRAIELARLTHGADDALASGDVDGARPALVDALERAPRHAEIVRTIAEIDVVAEGRGEAPLSLLRESLTEAELGAVGAELLAITGDLGGARRALETATSEEPYAPLAAAWWVRLAALEQTTRAGLADLDRAVALAPGLEAARWARFDARLAIGDVSGALADADHLEAGTRGGRARHAVCRRAGEALLTRGFVRDAGRIFERALRYVPDDPEATWGLARSFVEVGKSDRAAALLERAIDLGEARGAIPPEALLDLGRLLADRVGDLPGAIARVREVPSEAAVGPEARYLEATWRSRLGDLAGASLAYANLRSVLELGGEAMGARRAAQCLSEAADFERDVMADPVAAERHLAVALARRPRDEALAARYRELAAEALARREAPRDEG